MIDVLKWLLEAEVRWKNGISVLFGLMSVAIVYLVARHSAWFGEVAARGNDAIIVALSLALVVSFLAASLFLTAAVGVVTQHSAAKQKAHREYENLKRIGTILNSTTDWQRAFLIRYVVQDTMQIKEWEVGEYRAIWGPEVDVLCAKGIIRRHPSGVLEILPEYWQYLQAFWDPATERLRAI